MSGGELDPGDRFGPYLVERELGRGGMSVVYLAVEDSLARTVALKIMASHLHDDESYRRRFYTEARAAAAINHPHIIPIYAFGEEAERLYIAMQYIEGTDLRRFIEARGRLDPPMALAILQQASYALDAVHARGMTHRDIKPDNILLANLGRDGVPHVYVADFGLTRVEGDQSLTSTGQILGTVTYAAPEQMLGEPVDGRADVYALSCVLFEALTGRPPFEKNASAAVIYAHVAEERPPVSDRRPDLPPSLDAVLATGMAKRPDDRYRTAGELTEAFRLAAADWAPGTVPPPPTVAPAIHAPAEPSVDLPFQPIPPAPATAPSWSGESSPSPRPSAPDAAAGDAGVVPDPMVVAATEVRDPQRSRTPLLIGVAALVALLVIAAGVLVVTRRSSDVETRSPTDSTVAVGTASPGTAGRSSPGSGLDDRDKVLMTIDRALKDEAVQRRKIDEAIAGVDDNCRLPPEAAVNLMDQATNEQDTLIKSLQDYPDTSDDQANRLVQMLVTALERHRDADSYRRAWLQNGVSRHSDGTPAGCVDRRVPVDDNLTTAEAEKEQAIALKRAFVASWNPVAEDYGLPTWYEGDF